MNKIETLTDLIEELLKIESEYNGSYPVYLDNGFERFNIDSVTLNEFEAGNKSVYITYKEDY
jgi:hypothetical protein